MIGLFLMRREGGSLSTCKLIQEIDVIKCSLTAQQEDKRAQSTVTIQQATSAFNLISVVIGSYRNPPVALITSM